MWMTLLAMGLAFAQEEDAETPVEETVVAPKDTNLYDFEFKTTGKWKDEAIEPRLLLDNSAYTIGRNNFLVSPFRLEYGPLDNVQIGTNLIFDVFEIYNVKGKITAVRQKRFDASFETAYYRPDLAAALGLQTNNLYSSVVSLDWRASLIANEHFSIHGGQGWYLIAVGGDDFELGDAFGALARLFGADLSDKIRDAINDNTSTTLYGGADLTVRRNYLVLDARLNRRDQLLLIWSALVSSRGQIEAGAEFNDEVLGEASQLSVVYKFNLNLQSVLTNSVTLAWQMNWEHFHLRLGFTPPIGGVDGGTAVYNTLTEGIQAYWIF